jgi:hypothetical protein
MAAIPKGNSGVSIMATVPALPLFYNDLLPLSASEHADWKLVTQERAPFLAQQHAIPITIDEFVLASRAYPIIFSSGDNPVPLILMGMNEGTNGYVDDEGSLIVPTYVPAYVRRYPFLLARLKPDSDELSLCIDPTAPGVGPGDEGNALFEDGKPTEATNSILEFARQFEEAGARTGAFMEEVRKLDILMDGEVSIQPEGEGTQPFVYRGFQMVDENKLRDMRGDELRKLSQNGILPLLYAHLFSLSLMSTVFQMQVNAGKGPQPTIQAPQTAE